MRLPLTTWLALLLLASTATAQNEEPVPQRIDAKGKIHSLAAEQINVITEDEQPWQVQITKHTAVKLGGETSIAVLQAGMPVRFYGFFNNRGQATESVTAVTVFTPKENFAPLVELSPEEEQAEGEDDKDEAEPEEETASQRRARQRAERNKPASERYYISGVLTSLRRGKFVVNVGEQGLVKGEFAKDAVVKVDLTTHAAASPGDEISFRGAFFTPGQAQASLVEITLAPPEEDERTKRRKEKEEKEKAEREARKNGERDLPDGEEAADAEMDDQEGEVEMDEAVDKDAAAESDEEEVEEEL